MAKAKAKSKGNKGKKGKQAKLSKKKGVKRKVAAAKTRKGALKKKAAAKKRTAAPKPKIMRVEPAPVMDTSPEVTEVPTEVTSEPAMESTAATGTASEFTTTENSSSSM